MKKLTEATQNGPTTEHALKHVDKEINSGRARATTQLQLTVVKRAKDQIKKMQTAKSKNALVCQYYFFNFFSKTHTSFD